MSGRKNEVNILLLGETGAGKTTTLNLLANYMRFGSFDQALHSLDELVELVPCQLTVPHPKTGKQVIIQSGEQDSNEQLNSVGKSVTQNPVSYAFKSGEHVLRIIDTPGIGDTSGTEADHNNFDKIFSCLRFHETLHAVILVVKNSESRQTEYFKYCISQLLRNLHPSISENIFILFTYSRSSMFGPSDGFTTLQALLEKDFPILQMQSMVNCFFVDNEPYRFLIAKKKGYQYSDNQAEAVRESWIQSADQIEQMFAKIATLTPYNLDALLSLHSARKTVYLFSQPIVEMERNLMENIAKMHNQMDKLRQLPGSERVPENLQTTEITERKARKLPSNVVCISEECKNRDNDTTALPICHQACSCRGVRGSPNGQNRSIKSCIKMDTKLSKTKLIKTRCNQCGCSWKFHKKELYEFFDQKAKWYSNAPASIDKQTEKTVQERQIELQAQIEEFNSELCTILDIGTQLVYALNSDSYSYFGQPIIDYLEFLIRETRKKPDEVLLKLKVEHTKRYELLSTQQAEPIPLGQIQELKMQLATIKHSGTGFQNFLQTNAEVQNSETSYADIKMLQFSQDESNNSLIAGLKLLFQKQEASQKLLRIPLNQADILDVNSALFSNQIFVAMLTENTGFRPDELADDRMQAVIEYSVAQFGGNEEVLKLLTESEPEHSLSQAKSNVTELKPKIPEKKQLIVEPVVVNSKPTPNQIIAPKPDPNTEPKANNVKARIAQINNSANNNQSPMNTQGKRITKPVSAAPPAQNKPPSSPQPLMNSIEIPEDKAPPQSSDSVPALEIPPNSSGTEQPPPPPPPPPVSTNSPPATGQIEQKPPMDSKLLDDIRKGKQLKKHTPIDKNAVKKLSNPIMAALEEKINQRRKANIGQKSDKQSDKWKV